MIRKLILLFVLGVMILGAGAWFLATRNSDTNRSNTQSEPQPTAKTPDALEVKLHIPHTSLEQLNDKKSLQVSTRTSNDQKVVRIEYLLDGKNVAQSNVPPFEAIIDLAGLEKGEHTLQALAYDADGNVSKSDVAVFVIESDGSAHFSREQPSTQLNTGGSTQTSVVARNISLPSANNNSSNNSGSNNGSSDDNDDDSGAQPGMSWPSTPPAQICGNNSILGNGPTQPPQGAVVVPAGDNNDMFFDFRTPNTTFWFAPGTHTMGNDQFGQIQPGNNSTFIGAPGAIFDGQHINHFAFTEAGQNVTIRYLTIQNFAAPQQQGVVNHNDGRGWTVEYNTIHNNDGAGMMLGESNNIYRYNCIKDNGQYGINGCCGTSTNEVGNNIIDHNEITGNNADDWETQVQFCGCTGGMKLWENASGEITNNWIHDNHSVGIWLDNNNRSIKITGNYIADNLAEAIFVEAGYDTLIQYNNILRNNIEPGRHRAVVGDKFPIGAIYFSEAGSPAGYGLQYVPTIVSHNNFDNNWGGVILWESPDRYASSSANTHNAGTIKIGDLYDLTTCDGPNDTIPAAVGDKYKCRWSTENIIVENNDFRLNKNAIGTNCDSTNYCGINALFSAYGTYPEFPAYEIPTRITYQQGNLFRNNRYYGDWHFAGFDRVQMDGSRVTWQDWTAPAPQPPYNFDNSNRPSTFGQDQGSTIQP